MYLLDTDVLSELRKVKAKKGDRNVASWSKTVAIGETFISVITLHEIELGTLRLERKDQVQGAILRAWVDTRVLREFEGRIIAVDESVVRRGAKLHVPDPKPMHDALIAATALVHGMTVVTRNVVDFEPMGVEILNPWEWDE